jgi:hypothetical protein
MGCVSTSTALEHCPKVKSWLSFRSRLAAGGAVAGAGVLALGLVIAPPDSDGPSPRVQAVRLANLALSPAARSVVLLDEWVRSQSRNVAPVAVVVPAPVDITSAVTTARSAIVVNPPAFDLALDPATVSQKIRDAALAAAKAILEPLLGNPIISPIIGPILLFGGFGVLILAVTIIRVVDQVQVAISDLVGSLPALPLLRTASATSTDVEAIVATTLTSDPQVSDPAPATLTVEKEGVSPSMTSIDPPTPTKRLRSTTAEAAKDVTETVVSDDASTETTSAPASSASASTSESAKPAGRRATPRPVVRHSLDGGEQLGDLGHRRNGGHPATRRVAVDDATAGISSVTSSPAASSSKTSGSASGDSSGDDSADS